MLDSLQIKGFKLFRELTLPKLARLNLFVGANNSGKSCLLEAVRLYASDGSANVLREIVRSRDGEWEAKMAERASDAGDALSNIENPIRFLFHNFHCPAWKKPTIQIREIDAPHTLGISIGLYRNLPSDGVLGTIGTRHVPIIDETSESLRGMLGGVLADDAYDMLEISTNGATPTLHDLANFWVRRGSFGLKPILSGDTSRGVHAVVGTNGIAAHEVPSLWDNVSLTPQQGRVLDCLRLIEPRIEGLAFIGQSDRLGDRIPVVKLEGDAERLPLKAMGDGLTRLFHIALSMVNAENGVLLIDEFENGLYWEVQEQLWPVIFKMAEELNVQVFATTHSNDCLKSFVNAWSERPEMGSIYRLECSGDSTRAFPLPMVNVAGALASEIEVR